MSAGFSPREISILMHHTVRLLSVALLISVPCFTMAQSLPATGLEVSAMRCTDDGVEQGRTESANTLTGRVVRTRFTSSKPPKTTHGPASRTAFPLSEFPPDGPEVVYAEMQ